MIIRLNNYLYKTKEYSQEKFSGSDLDLGLRLGDRLITTFAREN
jgi:hypothetical protein